MKKKSETTFQFKIQNDIDISDWLRQYNIVVRTAYNRFIENPDLPRNEISNIIKNSNLNNIEKLDRSLIDNAVIEAKSLRKTSKVIFGSRKLYKAIKYFDLKKNPKVSKEECRQRFLDKRSNRSMMLVGSTSDKNGNRKAQLDIIDNDSIILKFNRHEYVVIKVSMNKKRRQKLTELQDLCSENKAFFTIKVNNENISITFDDKLLNTGKSQRYIPNRILSLDLNPNGIGLSICDWHSKTTNTVIHKEIIDVSELNKVKKYYYRKNKKSYETSIINKYIINLAMQYRCELVSFEHLDIDSKDYCRGKIYNKLVNNCWNRRKLLQNLMKRCNINNIKYREIRAYYSSFIGQMMYEDDYDSVAASIEISRRANLMNRKQYKDIIFPRFDVNCLPTRWKNMVRIEGIGSWKEFYTLLKKSRLNYRFLFALKDFQGVSFRLKSNKSLVMIRFV